MYSLYVFSLFAYLPFFCNDVVVVVGSCDGL